MAKNTSLDGKIKSTIHRIGSNLNKFFALNIDWGIYFLIILSFSTVSFLDIIPVMVENKYSDPVRLFIAYFITAMLFTAVFYFLLRKIKNNIFRNQSTSNTLIWHVAGLFTGAFFGILLVLESYQQETSSEIEMNPASFFFGGLIIGYFVNAFIYYLVSNIATDFAVRDRFQRFKRALLISIKEKSLLVFHSGVIISEWFYKNAIRAGRGIIIFITSIYLAMFLLVFPLLLVILCIAFCLTEIVFLINFQFIEVILILVAAVLVATLVGSILILYMSPVFLLSSYKWTRFFTMYSIHFAQGVTGSYEPLNTSDPGGNYHLDVMNGGFITSKVDIKNWRVKGLLSTVKDFFDIKINIAYWDPTIELSFFFMATMAFLNTVISLPGWLAFLGAVILAPSLLTTMWILEDLKVEVTREQNIDTVFGLIKVYRTSKTVVQLAAIYTVIKWLLTITDPATDWNIFLLSQPVLELLIGGFLLSVLLGMIGFFSWIYLRLFLKPRYKLHVDKLKDEIPKKTREVARIKTGDA